MKTLNERILKRISEISKNDCILKDLIIEDLLMLYTRYGEDIAMEIRKKHSQTHQYEIDKLKQQHAEEIEKLQNQKTATTKTIQQALEEATQELAVSAGANTISTNKKLQGGTFCVLKTGDVTTKQELSYYQAEMVLLFLSDCISEKGIDLEKLADHIENIDKYELKRN